MGTHPIFESDFDCLTDNYRWDVSSEPVVKVPAVFSRPSNEPERAQQSTDRWTLPNDTDLSKVSLRTSFTILAEVLHLLGSNFKTHTSSEKIKPSLSRLKVPPLVKLSTVERKQPFTLEMSSQSERCQKELHAVVLK